MTPRLKQAANALILIGGLAFCIVALARLQRQYPLHWSFNGTAIVGAVVCAILALAATASAWRRYLKAFVDADLSFRDALYQIGVMQIGKYVPVVIGGFVARISANASSIPAGRIVLASVVEQAGAMGTALLIGVCCYVLVTIPAALPLAVAFVALVIWFAPPVLQVATRIFTRWRGFSRSGSGMPARDADPQSLRKALGFQLLQMIAMTGFIGASISLGAPDMPLASLAAVTGAYLISIVVGIAVLFVPGGIGVREAAFVWLASAHVDSREALQLALALRIAMSALDLFSGAMCVALRLPLSGWQRTPGSK